MFEKITEQEIERRGVGNVSTTPTKKTPFGESGFDAKQLKERFDLLPRYIAERLNEVLSGMANGELADAMRMKNERYVGDILKGLYDGETAKEILIKTPTRDITIADVAVEVVKLLDELENGEFVERIMFDEENDVKEVLNGVADTANYAKKKVDYVLKNYYGKDEIDNILGDISSALDELHGYAEELVGGDAT